jgi:AcrR family transcriptional regulator
MTASIAPTQRSLQRDATRRELVQAGLRVVADQGFAAATTAAIAQASGRAHGTVFVHFKTREALVAELVEELGRTMSRRLAEPVGTRAATATSRVPVSETQAPSLTEVLDAHLAALAAHELLYARLLREATTLPEAARSRVFALQSGIGWRLRTAYERAVAAGDARALDPVLVVNQWLALTNHYLMNRDLFAPGKGVIKARGPALKAHFLALLRP